MVRVAHRRDRSSHQRCSVKKGVLVNFAKFTGKHLCHSLFFNKVAEHLFHRTPLGDCIWRENYFQKFQCINMILRPVFVKKIICWERRSFAALSSDLKHIFSMKKNIDYSSSLPYLIDINWLIGFIFPVRWLERKSQL